MLNPIEKVKVAILHLNRDWNHCCGYGRLYLGYILQVKESLHAKNIGKPNNFKASAGVKNDPRTRFWVKIDPRNPFT